MPHIAGGSAFFVRPLTTIYIMTINPVDIAKDIINLGATAGVKKDVIDLQAAKLLILTDELAAARKRATQFELDYNNLKMQLERLHPIQKPADTCPFCRRATGDLIQLKPHDIFGDHGVKVGYYKCSSCGQKYDKQIKP